MRPNPSSLAAHAHTHAVTHALTGRLARGFTLIELMVTLAIIAILAAIAVPGYGMYIQRSRVPVGLDSLQAFYARMEQRFQDVGNYANGTNCALAAPGTVGSFTVSCELTNSGAGFTATATGSGALNGYSYTINHQGVRATTAHPGGVPATNCWSTKGGTCDT